MSESRKGSRLAGVGGIAFGVLTVVALVVGGAPGGNYTESDVANYIALGHLPTVIVTGYLAVVGVLGLICLLAFFRGAVGSRPNRSFAADIFWGAGLASAASFAVAWGLITGIAVAAAEGGSAASVPHATTYVLSDTMLNVLYGSGGILLGFALIALMLGSRDTLPSWVRWLTLIAGLLAITAPFYFAAPAVPLWGIVVGAWLTFAGRLPSSAPVVQRTA